MRQTGQCLDLLTPMAGAAWLCVLMLSASCPATGGHYISPGVKFWNLTNLFHPEAWMWTFLTIILITVSLKLASLLGSKLGLNVVSEELALIPFRLNIKMIFFV